MQRLFNLTLVFSLIFFAGNGFAQSKKERNAQLKEDFYAHRDRYKAQYGVYERNQQTLLGLRQYAREMMSTDRRTLEQRNQMLINASRSGITTLNKLGIAMADTLQKTEIDMKNTLERMSLRYNMQSEMMKQSFYFTMIDDTIFPTGLKLKAQNAVLTEKIQQFMHANDVNSELIKQQEAGIAELKGLQESISHEMARLWSINSALTKSANLISLRLDGEKLRYFKNGPKGFSKAYEETFGIPLDELAPMGVEDIETEGFADIPPVQIPDTPVKKQEPDVYDYVEEYAQFPGGVAAMRDYLAKNLKYPEIARDAGIEGKCYLKFVVSNKGEISNVQVMRGIPGCKECDNEAIRVVKSMPNWIPGKNNGKPVNSYFHLPVSFKINP